MAPLSGVRPGKCPRRRACRRQWRRVIAASGQPRAATTSRPANLHITFLLFLSPPALITTRPSFTMQRAAMLVGYPVTRTYSARVLKRMRGHPRTWPDPKPEPAVPAPRYRAQPVQAEPSGWTRPTGDLPAGIAFTVRGRRPQRARGSRGSFSAPRNTRMDAHTLPIAPSPRAFPSPHAAGVPHRRRAAAARLH